MRLVAIVARVGASVDTAGLFSPRPLAKGAEDGQDQPLGGAGGSGGDVSGSWVASANNGGS